MKQTCLINAKEDEKGIAGQACNDRSFQMKRILKAALYIVVFLLVFMCIASIFQ
jgi:hypothetical protein